jgi:pimeloyl-ACP methyl ester carboxylesterase
VRWHLPSQSANGGAATRGTGGGVVFRLPLPTTSAPADAATQDTRSVLGAVGRQLLKVLVYPVTDIVVGRVADAIATRWEREKRPHRLRHFTPANYRSSVSPSVTKAELEDMAKAGPVLLFIHGTFSTAHGGFGDIPQETMEALHKRYGGRVFAFDHPTLSVDPFENVRWLLGQLPDAPMTVDIVCHSRGGLVSRALAEAPSVSGLDASRVTVRKLVLGATPNQGTLLADPDHMVAMIDRLTTALTLFPTGPVTETLEALVTVVKTLGHGSLNGLDGLRSMCPGGNFLGALNGPGANGADYFAIAANYEPVDRGLRALVTGGANVVVDQVFEGAENDLVVPTEGVYARNGNARFPVPDARRVVLGADQGTMHTTVFQHPEVSRRLLAWL